MHEEVEGSIFDVSKGCHQMQNRVNCWDLTGKRWASLENRKSFCCILEDEEVISIGVSFSMTKSTDVENVLRGRGVSIFGCLESRVGCIKTIKLHLLKIFK